jgi:hypothetical protein
MAKQKLKLPKRLAGIKISKPLRRSGKRFLKYLNKSGGLELLAEAFVAAATVLVADSKRRREVPEAGQGVGHGLTEGGNALSQPLSGQERKKDKRVRQKPYSAAEPDQRRH